MSFINAINNFSENLRLFVSPDKNPEKYNLNAGLQNLANGLQNLESKIDELSYELKKIKRNQ